MKLYSVDVSMTGLDTVKQSWISITPIFPNDIPAPDD